MFFCPSVLQSHSWQPGIKNPYRGVVVWPVPENIEITVTLFKVGYSCLSSTGTGIYMFNVDWGCVKVKETKTNKTTSPQNLEVFHQKLILVFRISLILLSG